MTRFFLRRPVTTWMIFASFVVMAIYAVPRIEVEAIPELDLPSLTIQTQWNGASPKAIQRSITLPVEEAVRNVYGVESVTSTSRAGMSLVEVEFRREIDIEFARLNVNEQLGSVRRGLPLNATQPQILPVMPEEFRTEQFFSFSIESPLSPNELRERAEKWIVPQVLAIDGVGEPAEVERGEIARRVVEVEVLAARVAAVDPTGRRSGVPAVDRRVELHTRVGAFPRCPAGRAPQLARPNRADGLARRDRSELPVAVVDDRLHEVVGDADRVVGVLELDRRSVGAAESHVEPGVAQYPDLAFLAGLGLDELLDVGVVDIEDHHLRGPPGGAARLDRTRRRVGAAHEADRARRRAATSFERLDRARGCSRGWPRAGPSLEDEPLVAIPVEDRPHVVVDRQDETGTRLLDRRPSTPMLNHTGLLNAARWVVMRYFSSARNASVSSSSAK